MIEPNIHPVFVHFTFALLTLSALSLFVVAVSRSDRDTLRHAGDWMLAFGVIAAVATVAAGFQAYYSVAHDGPSHAAMTTHRNWAVPTAVAVLFLALWRFTKRSAKPGLLFASLFLTAAGLLTVTAWWGGRVVYAYGIGVKTLPQATGEGHDHEHAPGEEHGPSTDVVADASVGVVLAKDDQPGSAAAPGAYPATPEAVVDAFAAALKRGDAAAVERLLAPDVLIAEGGGAERSFSEYQGHHLPADMEFSKTVETTIKDRRVFGGADMATIVTTAQVHGTFRDNNVHSQMMETMVLRQADGEWRIAHIHWSSAPIEGEYEH